MYSLVVYAVIIIPARERINKMAPIKAKVNFNYKAPKNAAIKQKLILTIKNHLSIT